MAKDANREMRSGPNWGAASLLIAVVAGGYFLWTKKGSKNGMCLFTRELDWRCNSVTWI